MRELCLKISHLAQKKEERKQKDIEIIPLSNNDDNYRKHHFD